MVQLTINPFKKGGIDFSWDLPNTIVPDEDLPEGMEPMWEGSPIYRSPQTPDPRNCIWYPESPQCGGLGISGKPAELNMELTMDACGRTHLQLTGSLLFLHMPTHQWSYVPEHCRNPLPDPPPRPPSLENPNPMHPRKYQHFEDEKMYILALDDPPYIITKLNCDIVKIAVAEAMGDWTTVDLPQYYTGDTGAVVPIVPFPQAHPTFGSLPVIYRSRLYKVNNDDFSAANTIGDLRFSEIRTRPILVSGQGKSIKAFLSGEAKAIYYEDIYGGNAFSPPLMVSWYGMDDKWQINKWLHLGTCTKEPRFPPPGPPKPPRKDCDCMNCCSQSQNDLEDIRRMLRQILKQQGNFPSTFKIFDADENAQEAQSTDKSIPSIIDGVKENSDNINKLAKIIGIDQLPITAPESLIDPINDNWLSAAWDFITPDATVKIKSVIEFQKYILDYINASTGHFQQEINVTSTKTEVDEETGEVKEVEVKEKIVVADLATSVKELILMAVSQYKATGMINDMVFKLLIQTALTQKESAKISAIVQDIQQYLDYPTREKTLQTRIQITPPSDNVPDEEFNEILKILQPSDAKFKYDDWTGENSLTDLIINIASLASRNRGG